MRCEALRAANFEGGSEPRPVLESVMRMVWCANGVVGLEGGSQAWVRKRRDRRAVG
jgi:hypothetical protein